MINLFNIDDTQDFEFLLSQMGREVTINNSNESTKVIITNTNLEDNYDDKKITSLSELNRGDIIDYDNKRYLIISEQSTKRYNKYKAIMRQLPHRLTINCDCNFIKVDGYVTSSNLSVTGGNLISYASGEIHLHISKLQYNSMIKIGHRFFIGNQVFKIIGIDDFSRDGIVTFTCKLDSINTATDDIENGIAGGLICETTKEDEDDEIIVKEIVISSDASAPSELRKNVSKEYYVTVTNNETVNVKWELYADDQFSNTTLAVITAQNSATCTVKNNNVTSGYVQLKATLESDETVFAWYRIQMKGLY